MNSNVLKLAQDFNFYGKRKRDSKLEVCEDIISELHLKSEPCDVLEWLEDNRPVKERKERTQKPSADTMAGNAVAPSKDLPVLEGQRFIVTGGQNNTNSHQVFKQLKDLSENYGAKLVVAPIYYNKNAFSAAVEDENEYFNSDIKPFIQLDDCWLGYEGAIKLMASAAVLPTQKLPVNAAAQLNTGEKVTIVASPKQQLRTLPRLNQGVIKEAWTTGACTEFHYTRSRAGTEAEHDHKFGALWVEIAPTGEVWVTNLILGEDEAIQFFTPEYQRLSARPSALVLGDLHCERYDPIIWGRTIELIREARPELLVVHDILHFETRSHHNRGSGRHLYTVQDNTVEKDLMQVICQLNELAQYAEVYIVESNHNSALDNWLDDSKYSPKTDPQNAKLYYLLNWLVCDSIDKGESDKNALQVALENADLTTLPPLADNIRFGAMDKAEIIQGVDVSQHGHKGQNGSAGNHNLLHKWRLRMVTAHIHSPAITGDVYTVGVTASLYQGYNRGGASSWQHSHAFILPNGAVQMFNMNPQ